MQADLAFVGSHLGEERLGDLGPLHLVLDLVVNGGRDAEQRVELEWQLHMRRRRRLRLMEEAHRGVLLTGPQAEQRVFVETVLSGSWGFGLLSTNGPQKKE